MTVKVTADLKKLESILKKLGGDYVARVGILDNNATSIHDGSEITNGELGLIHEFGSEVNNIPARSFLRMPLEEKQDSLMKAIDSPQVKKSIESGDIETAYKALGIAGEQIVKEAFMTSGFGKWAANAPITINGGLMYNKVSGAPVYVKGKGFNKPLIETGDLSRSISSDVVKKGSI